MEDIIHFLDYFHWKLSAELSSDFPVYLLKEGHDTHAIILIDGNAAGDLTKERYRELVDEVRQAVPSKGEDDITVLSLFVTSESAKYAILADGTVYWIVTPNGRIIVRTGQPEDYCNMREELHKSLTNETEAIQKSAKTDSEGKTIVRYQTLRPYKDNGFMSDCADSFITCYFTIILIAVNVLAYVIPYSMYGSEGIADSWLKFASSWNTTIGKGQVWRAFTCLFIHAGTTHLVANMLALLFIGYFLERRISRKMYLAVYFGGGIIGSFASLLYHFVITRELTRDLTAYRDNILYDFYARIFSQDILCAGASGAVMALAGACAFRLTIGKAMDGYWKGEPHIFLDFFVILACIITLADTFFEEGQPGIDMSAHIGGALGGFLIMGLFLILMYLKERRNTYNLI